MGCHVTVVTGNGERHEFDLHDADLAGMDARQAQEWLGKEFEAAGCVPTNPVGKLLLADKILECEAQARSAEALARQLRHIAAGLEVRPEAIARHVENHTPLARW